MRGPMTDATREALAVLGVDPASVEAVAAMLVARHVDAADGGLATPALMRELKECMAWARAAVSGPRPDPRDELARRRRR